MLSTWISLLINFLLLILSIWFLLDPDYFCTPELFPKGIVWIIFNIPLMIYLMPFITAWGVIIAFRKL